MLVSRGSRLQCRRGKDHQRDETLSDGGFLGTDEISIFKTETKDYVPQMIAAL
jgi:hypothetical protein